METNGKFDWIQQYIVPDRTRATDSILLEFADGRQTFCDLSKSKDIRILKKSFKVNELVGLKYGTVLEQRGNKLVVLPDNSPLVPELPDLPDFEIDDDTHTDNRAIVDDNTAQKLDQGDLETLKDSKTGAEIVQDIISNSSTFGKKTTYSREKYIRKKQTKYQLRCRIVRCNAMTICGAMFLKDPKKIMNLRQDTLAQILSLANISAGSQVLLFETTLGILTGAIAERLAGYGRILSIFTGQQHTFADTLSRYNLNFVQTQSIHWVHAGDALSPDTVDMDDPEAKERDALEWPCLLQSHTRNYIQTDLQDRKKREAFLEKRQSRFVRKLCRNSPLECFQMMKDRQSDSLIVAVRYDPTQTLLSLLPHLASSCPFVVFCEFIEPLTECFKELQSRNLAINLRLSDCWMREYQVLPERTHPNMNMSQSGGFLLSGIKLDESTGTNELDPATLQSLKEKHGRARHGRKSKPKKTPSNTPNNKRQRVE